MTIVLNVNVVLLQWKGSVCCCQAAAWWVAAGMSEGGLKPSGKLLILSSLDGVAVTVISSAVLPNT
jgi:hypothetical protein